MELNLAPHLDEFLAAVLASSIDYAKNIGV